MNKINIAEKLSLFSDYWNPKVIAELNGQQIKLAKFKGEFVWHKHDNKDEMFYVLNRTLTIEFRDKTITLKENECLVVPKGTEHKPVAENEVSVLLFEPMSTRNTGNNPGELTQKNLEKL